MSARAAPLSALAWGSSSGASQGPHPLPNTQAQAQTRGGALRLTRAARRWEALRQSQREAEETEARAEEEKFDVQAQKRKREREIEEWRYQQVGASPWGGGAGGAGGFVLRLAMLMLMAALCSLPAARRTAMQTSRCALPLALTPAEQLDRHLAWRGRPAARADLPRPAAAASAPSPWRVTGARR